MDEISVNKPKVLLVDDEKGIVNFLKLKLKLSGYEVDSCSSGEECLRLIPQVKPDIMLLDVNLPGMNGLEVLRKLRTFSEIPVIILSGRHSVNEEFTGAGASAFIRKPFDLDELVSAMNTLLQRG